jgi:hypothetical protein
LQKPKPNGNRIKLEHDMRQVNPITEKELGQNCYDTEIILTPAKRQKSCSGSQPSHLSGVESFIIGASEKKATKKLINV